MRGQRETSGASTRLSQGKLWWVQEQVGQLYVGAGAVRDQGRPGQVGDIVHVLPTGHNVRHPSMIIVGIVNDSCIIRR